MLLRSGLPESAHSVRRLRRYVLPGLGLFVACGSDASTEPRANRDPVASIEVDPPSVPEADDHRTVVVLDGSRSSDPDGDDLTFEWFVPDAAFTDGASRGAVSARVTFPGRVPLLVTLTVRDGRGGIGQAARSVAIEQSPLINQPPRAVLVVFPEWIPEGDNHNTVVSGDATPSSDPDGDALTYRWEVPQGRFVNGTDEASRTIQVTFPGSAPHRMTLIVDDGQATARDSVFIMPVR